MLALHFVADKRFDDIIERFRQDDMEVADSLPTPIIVIVAVFVLVWLVLHPCSCADRDAGGGLYRRSDGEWALIKRSLSSPADSVRRWAAWLVIGLGVMMGRLLEVSGAAERIARSFIKWLGKRREGGRWRHGLLCQHPHFRRFRFCHSLSGGESAGGSGKRSLLTLGVARWRSGLVVTLTIRYLRLESTRWGQPGF